MVLVSFDSLFVSTIQDWFGPHSKTGVLYGFLVHFELRKFPKCYGDIVSTIISYYREVKKTFRKLSVYLFLATSSTGPM